MRNVWKVIELVGGGRVSSDGGDRSTAISAVR